MRYLTMLPAKHRIFILLSIKTRIETSSQSLSGQFGWKFLSYYPLKQGLKLIVKIGRSGPPIIFILLSIKTRIETPSKPVT